MSILKAKSEIEINNYNITISKCNDFSNLSNIEVVENNSLSYNDFFEKYMIKNLPCVVKNISSNWDCAGDWIKGERINYDYFISKYGNLLAPVADCNNVFFNSHCKNDMKVSEYMEYLKIVDKDKLLYLKDWHLRRQQPCDNFYTVPLIFSSDWLNEFAQDHQEDDYMFVYIGPKNSWTPLHADVYCSYSWSVNVTGKKKWILFPPGEENKLQDSLGNLPILFDEDKNQNIKYFEVIQEKGDGLFVPSGWHHQVLNMLDTISINHNWINGCNIDYVWEALQKNIISVEHEIEDLKDSIEYSSQCQLILKSVFGMDFNMFVKFLLYIGNKRIQQLQTSNIIGFQNFSYGIKLIKFDLITIMKLINNITSHPLFFNKEIISIEMEKELIILKKSILQEIPK